MLHGIPGRVRTMPWIACLVGDVKRAASSHRWECTGACTPLGCCKRFWALQPETLDWNQTMLDLKKVRLHLPR
jgi:hypothetical protein